MRIASNRRMRRVLSGVVAGTGLSLGVAGAGMAETVLRIVPRADLKNIDPVWTTAAITANHGYMVYDMPFAMDSNLEPHPQMVDSWDVGDDGLTNTIPSRCARGCSSTTGLRWRRATPWRRSSVGRPSVRTASQ